MHWLFVCGLALKRQCLDRIFYFFGLALKRQCLHQLFFFSRALRHRPGQAAGSKTGNGLNGRRSSMDNIIRNMVSLTLVGIAGLPNRKLALDTAQKAARLCSSDALRRTVFDWSLSGTLALCGCLPILARIFPFAC